MVLSGVQERLGPWLAPSLGPRLAPFNSWLFPRRVHLEIQDRALTALALDGRCIAWCETLPLPEGVLVGGHPQAVEALGDLLGDWLIERGYGGARLKAVLPWRASAWRVLQWPATAPGRPLADLLPVELGPEAFGAPLEQLDLNLHPLRGGEEALLYGARADLLEAWMAVVAQAGLELDGLEAAGLCCVRAAAAAQARWLLCVEPEQCWLVLLRDGAPRWQWPLPGPHQAAALGEALGACRGYIQRVDPAVLATPLALVAAGGGGLELSALLPELRSVVTAGVEPLDPLGGGTLGLLWGLALTEMEP